MTRWEIKISLGDMKPREKKHSTGIPIRVKGEPLFYELK